MNTGREEIDPNSTVDSSTDDGLLPLELLGMDADIAKVFADEVDGPCDLPRLKVLLDVDLHLLLRPYKNYGNLWEWILHHRRARSVASFLLSFFPFNEETGCNNMLVPINSMNKTTGHTVLTTSEHGVLKANVLLILLEAGENLDYINPVTGDSFLHAIAKLRRHAKSKIQRKEALNSVNGIINKFEEDPLLCEDINFPNPDRKNIDGMTALHLSLEADDMIFAKLLVTRLGASHSVKPSGRFTLIYELGEEDKTAIIKSWENDFGIRSNTSEVGNEGDVCMVCLDPLDTPDELYLLECCGKILHTECLKTSLARGSTPRCMLCNMLHTELIRCKVPNTIYKMKWGPITIEDLEASAEARRRTAAAKLAASLAKSKEEEEAANRKIEVVQIRSDEDEEEEKEEDTDMDRPPVLDDDFVLGTITYRLPFYLQRKRSAAIITSGRRRSVGIATNGRRRRSVATTTRGRGEMNRRNNNNNRTEWGQEDSGAGPS